MSNVLPFNRGSAVDENWPTPLQRNQHGAVIANLHNVLHVLVHHDAVKGVIGFDTFRRRKTKRKKPPFFGQVGAWCDTDTHELRVWFSSAMQMNVSAEIANHAIESACQRNAFDSLTDEIESFQWDGSSRLDRLAIDYFGAADTPVHSLFGARFLVQAMARAYSPGCKADCMLVLEGKQGKKKSTALQALFGAEYYKDSYVDFHSKDGMAAISEVWCQEIPELDSLKRSGITAIKAFLTNRVDSYRPAYGREIVERPRRCVFAGTTNEDVWNEDATGGRRFWSIECSRTLNIDAIARDRAVLLAEARELYRSGAKWWVDEDDVEAVAVRETQAARLNEHPWSEKIQTYISSLSEFTRNEGLSAYEVLKDGVGIEIDRVSGRDGQVVGHIMRSLGWRQDKQQTTRQGAKAKRYRPEVAEVASVASQGAYDDEF